MSIAWVLNLDADLELAAGKTYSPTNAVLAQMRRFRGLTAMAFLARGDALIDDPGAAKCEFGRAFCPTPRAIAEMRNAGVEPEPHPDVSILRRVNGRGFCAEMGETLPGARFVTNATEAAELIARPPPVGRQWRAKRAFGMAGRGQRPLAVGPLSVADAHFIATSIEHDAGIQVEPEVELVREVSMHGMLDRVGGVRLGRVVALRCDDAGQCVGTAPTTEELPELAAEMRRVAEALASAEYFGPFNVDAYFYRHEGEIRFQPRSEINARYSLGFPASGLFSHIGQ